MQVRSRTISAIPFEGVKYPDEDLEEKWRDFYMLDEIQGANCQIGEWMLEDWERVQQRVWNTHCRACWKAYTLTDADWKFIRRP